MAEPRKRTSSSQAAVGLSQSMDRRTEVLRQIRRILIPLAVMTIAVLGFDVYRSIQNGRQLDLLHDLSAARTQTFKQLQEQGARLEAAVDPKGCIARRAKAQTSIAILALENDNRSIHGKPMLPVADEVKATATQVCPGEPGGPALVASTTTRPPRRSSATTRPRRQAVPASRPTPPTTTSTQAVAPPTTTCVLPLSPCPTA